MKKFLVFHILRRKVLIIFILLMPAVFVVQNNRAEIVNTLVDSTEELVENNNFQQTEEKKIRGNCLDFSLTASYNHQGRNKVFLVSFAEGEVHKRNQNFLAHSAINKGIDVIINYNKSLIDPIFYEQNKTILEQKRGAGYWLWKPYFILETLKIMNENDVLIYFDSSTIINKPIDPILRLLDDKTNIILFDSGRTNRRWNKRDLYSIMEVPLEKRDTRHLVGGFIIIKKNQDSFHFISEWLKYACIEQAITDKPSILKEFDDFIDHRHDQSILSLLYLKMPQKVKVIKQSHSNLRKVFIHHHRTNQNVSLMHTVKR